MNKCMILTNIDQGYANCEVNRSALLGVSARLIMRPIREGLLRSMIRQVVLPYMLALSTCLSCSDAQIGERDAWLSSTFIKDHLHLSLVPQNLYRVSLRR